MLRKIVSLSAVILLLASYSANAMSMDCGDMSPEDCKKEFMMKMDKEVMMKMMEMMKMQMMKRMEMFSAMKDDMPADSMHAKMLMDAVDEMKKQMPMVEKMGDMDMEKMEHTMVNAFMAMKPDFEKAQREESDMAEKFEESMDKHGYMSMQMMEEAVKMFMKDVEQMWMEMYNSLRPEDMKEYPQYTEINNMMKSMMEVHNKEEKMTMMVKLMKMMNEFMETPFMKAAMDMVCDNC